MQYFQRWSSLSAFLAVLFSRCCLSGAELPERKVPSVPSELVQTALRAELNHDSAARNIALTRALTETPQDPTAHWHLGQVRVGDEWLPVQEAEAKTAADPRLMEYRQLRDSSSATLDGQIALARWCRKQNLDVQEQLHWVRVMQLSPQNKEAQSRLGLQEFQGQYLTRDEIDAVKEQVELAESAMKKWRPRAQQWRKAFASRDPAIRSAALKELDAIRDLEAIPALEEFLAPANAEAELAVVGVLSRIEEQIATDFLIRHSVLSEDLNVREAAALALKQRSLFAYVPALLGALKAPVEYSYFADTLCTEGPSQILEVSSSAYFGSVLLISRRHGFMRVFSASPNERIQTAKSIQRFNMESEALNQRIYESLLTATGQKLPKEPRPWWQWWQQYNELQASQDSSQKQLIQSKQLRYRTCSCFLPGTKVWLDSGPLPIEKVRPGDRVLSQDPETGELDYRFVVDTTIRPPSPTLRIGLPKEEIAATLGHPIWVVGKGWRMAKEIAVGDYLHGLHGGVPVEYIEKGPESNAFNLVVADFNTYCIGDHRILVHDNMARKPTQAVVPGFVPRELAAK